jgi:hypothetical protein
MTTRKHGSSIGGWNLLLKSSRAKQGKTAAAFGVAPRNKMLSMATKFEHNDHKDKYVVDSMVLCDLCDPY